MEQSIRAKDPAPTVMVEPPPLTQAVAPVKEVKQLVRTIGVTDSPETQAVGSVNKTLAGHLNNGWTIHTAHPVAAGVGGSVVVYFLLIK